MDCLLEKQKAIIKKDEIQFLLVGFKGYKGSAIKHNWINYIFVIYIFEKI